MERPSGIRMLDPDAFLLIGTDDRGSDYLLAVPTVFADPTPLGPGDDVQHGTCQSALTYKGV